MDFLTTILILLHILVCNGASLREQLEHIAKMKMENLGYSRDLKQFRRYNAFQAGQNSLILGAPNLPSHLPEAEALLPGHTLIRPALGMLKSSVKFPHRDWEGGSGVYGNIDNLGISWAGTNERVLYTGFRRNGYDLEIPTSKPNSMIILLLKHRNKNKKTQENDIDTLQFSRKKSGIDNQLISSRRHRQRNNINSLPMNMIRSLHRLPVPDMRPRTLELPPRKLKMDLLPPLDDDYWTMHKLKNQHPRQVTRRPIRVATQKHTRLSPIALPPGWPHKHRGKGRPRKHRGKGEFPPDKGIPLSAKRNPVRNIFTYPTATPREYPPRVRNIFTYPTATPREYPPRWLSGNKGTSRLIRPAYVTRPPKEWGENDEKGTSRLIRPPYVTRQPKEWGENDERISLLKLQHGFVKDFPRPPIPPRPPIITIQPGDDSFTRPTRSHATGLVIPSDNEYYNFRWNLDPPTEVPLLLKDERPENYNLDKISMNEKDNLEFQKMIRYLAVILMPYINEIMKEKELLKANPQTLKDPLDFMLDKISINQTHNLEFQKMVNYLTEKLTPYASNLAKQIETVKSKPQTLTNDMNFQQMIRYLADVLMPYLSDFVKEKELLKPKPKTLKDPLNFQKDADKIIQIISPYLDGDDSTLVSIYDNAPKRGNRPYSAEDSSNYPNMKLREIRRNEPASSDEVRNVSSEIEIDDLDPPTTNDPNPKLTWFVGTQDSLPGSIQSHKNKPRRSRLD